MKNPKYKTLGQLLQQHRKAAGLKQKQLAEKLTAEHISVTFLSQIEKGWKRPRPESISAIAKALNLTRGKTIELFIAADYGMPTEIQLDISNVMIRTVLAVLEDIPNTQEVISDTAKNIFIGQVKQLVNLWGNYSEARALLYDGKMEPAQSKMENALNIQKRLDSATRAHILDARGELSYRRGHLKIAHEQFSTAHDNAKLAGDDLLAGITTIHLGDIARMDGRWDEALSFYQTALDMFENLKHLSNIDQAERNAATIHLFRGDWTVLESASAVDQTDRHNRAINSHILAKNGLLLAWAYSLRGDWQQSLTIRQNVLSNALQKNLRVNAMFAHVFVADGLLQLGDIQKAEFHYKQAYEFFDQYVAEIERGYVLLGLARVNQAKGPAFWIQAEELFRASSEMNLRVNYCARYGLSLHYYGRFFAEQYSHTPQPELAQKAYELFYQALEIFTGLRSPYYCMKALLGLMTISLSESSLGRFYEFGRQFHQVSHANATVHHKLLFQYFMLNAQEKLKRMNLIDAADDYVFALGHALRFNIFLLQSFQEVLQGTFQQMVQIADVKHVRLFLERLLNGISDVAEKPWFSSLYFDRKEKVDWMMHYFGNILRRL